MTTRTPLILIILKLPIQLIQLVLYLTGTLSYIPIYIYCLIFSKFLFNQAFDNNNLFYIIFFPLRTILSSGSFLLGGIELYLIYLILIEFIHFDSYLVLVITLTSILGFITFSFKFGYAILFNKLKLPQLKSVKEHLVLVIYGIQDILSVLFAVITAILIFRIKELLQYQPLPQQRGYFRFSFRMLTLSIYDLVCVVFWVIVWILHWRYPYTKRIVDNIKSEEQKHTFVMIQAGNAIFDLIFIPMLLLTVLNPFLKGKRLLIHMSQLSVISWRRLIFDEFMCSLIDIPAWLGLFVSIISLYQIPLIWKVYKNVVKETKPYDFKEETESLKKINDHSQQANLGIKIHNYIQKNDKRYRPSCFFLPMATLLDIVILISNILLMASVYRYLILTKKFQTYKMEATKKESKSKDTFSYSEYRQSVVSVISSQEDENKSINYTYPKLVISETLSFLSDIPILIICILLLIEPWRMRAVIAYSKEEWRRLEQPKRPPDVLSLRVYATTCALFGILDYFGFLCCALLLAAFWRWNYAIPEFRKILTSDISLLKDTKGNKFLTKFDAINHLVFETLKGVIVDLLFSPMLVFFVPLYLICFWRIKLLIRCLQKCEVSDFSAHRLLIYDIGILCVMDILKFLPLFISLITLYRISDFKILWTLHKAVTNDSADQSSNQAPKSTQESYQTSKNHSNEEIQNYDDSKKRKISSKAFDYFKNETKVPYLEAGRNTFILVILDILSIPFLILAVIKLYKLKTKLEELKKKTAITATEYYQKEKDKIAIRFEVGIKSFITLVFGTFALIAFCFLLWRLPTLIILIQRADLKDSLLRQLIKDENKRDYVKSSFLQQITVLISYCFLQFLEDLVFVPSFIALLTLTIWRAKPVLTEVYQYDINVKFEEQLNKQRSLVWSQLKLGFGDIFACLKIIIILVTIVRIPFLVAILVKNRFPNSSLYQRLYGKDELKGISQEKSLGGKLHWKKCVNITFKELIKDFPFLICGLIIMIVAPWRAITIWSILASQIERVPSHDVEAKKIKIYSRRTEIFLLLVGVIIIDWIQIFKILLITLTIHRIPNLLTILKNVLKNFNKYQQGQLSLTDEIGLEFKKSLNDYIKLFCSVIILVFVVRVKATIRRLQAYSKYYQYKNKKYVQHIQDEGSGEKKLSLDDVTWDVYGRICQYLTVRDLGALNGVNKKFHELNKKDFYWEYQYKRDWKEFKGLTESVSFREKCIAAYKQVQRQKVRQPLTPEERDNMLGSVYILFDEMIRSFKLLPHIILIPVRVLAFMIMKMNNPSNTMTSYFPVRRRDYMDGARFLAYDFFQDRLKLMPRKFKYIQENFLIWVELVLLKYICELGYIIGYIGLLIVRKTSAGETANFEVRFNPEALDVEFLPINYQNNLPEIQNELTKFIHYILQLLATITYIIVILIVLISPGYLLCKCFYWSWYYAIFGPCLLYVAHYLAIINGLVTVSFIIYEAAPHFRPYRAFIMTAAFFKRKTIRTWEIVGKPLFDHLARILKLTWRNLAKTLKLIFSQLQNIIKLIANRFKFAGQGIVKYYTDMLIWATNLSLKYGLPGDLFLTVFALIWMLWPLIIPVYLENKTYFIPSGLLSLILVLVGSKKIQNTWRNNSI